MASTGTRTRRRVVLERVWILLTVLYGIGRAVVVGAAFGDHGVDPWLYLVIDLVTSVPLGLSTARVIGGLVDRDFVAVRGWAVVAIASFLAPDLYVVIAGRGIPPAAYGALGGFVAASAAISVLGVRRRAAAGRAAGRVGDARGPAA